MSVARLLEPAESLPPRLVRFFKRYPPPLLFPRLQPANSMTSTTTFPPVPTIPADKLISTTPPSDPKASMPEPSSPHAIFARPGNISSRVPPEAYDLPYPNPFLPTKDFTTGRWRGAIYGLRKQADLVKLASAHGVLDLLPWTIKKPGEKESRRIERGLEVKGTGVGQKVKGKKWERTMPERLETRRQAMLIMPELIQQWKQKGHGRGWKKWPSSRAKK